MIWKDSYKIGVPRIDEEHKKLCDQMDLLFTACNQGKGRSEVINTLNFLIDYTAIHFQHEEELQRSSTYPKYQQHKLIHDAFIKQVKSMKEEVEQQGANLSSVFKVNTMISQWLINHIQVVDKELSIYVNK